MKRKIQIRPVNISVVIISVGLVVLGSLTQSCNGTMKKQEVSHWYGSQKWLKGLQLKPHSSTNQKEFEKQYKANPEAWDMAFEWLRTTDLDAIEPGTYTIKENDVKAIVSDTLAPELEAVKWEAHKDFNDLQYIVKGKAKMGVSPVTEATVKEAYDPDSDVGFFDAEGEYYTAEPGTFFIFTPKEAHRPGIRVEGYNTVKKIVIKVRTGSR
jgi:YhcH/YjgK/YiaL family protein